MYFVRRLSATVSTRVLQSGAVLSLIALATPWQQLRAQMGGFILGGTPAITAGGEMDSYFRYLETLGEVPRTPWSLRAFSPTVGRALYAGAAHHPWAGSWLFQSPDRGSGSLLPITLTTRVNSAYPWGSNDGAIWAGRGVTSALSGGFVLAAGRVTVVAAPILFWAANSTFALLTPDAQGVSRFASPDFAYYVDRPQRFGDRPYSRLDPGQSSVTVRIGNAALGVSTANQWWGPAAAYPFIIGNNAPGIPHVFLGTASPQRIGVGAIQARVVYGIESQSAYSPVSGSTTFVSPASPGTKRLMTGLIFTLQLDAVPGLELGAARYFHQAWLGRVGRTELASPFEGLLKNSLPRGRYIPGIGTRDPLKNQLASLFWRWAPPKSGFDVYGEYGREDHSADIRDLASEPDHSRVLSIGFRKAFPASENRFSAIRLEIFDGTAPSLLRHRGEGLVYIHNPIRQGHTMEGQLIGADAGVGSPSAALLAWDRYDQGGRMTIVLTRTTENNPPEYSPTLTSNSSPSDVAGSLGMERIALTQWGSIWAAAAFIYRGGRSHWAVQRGLNLNAQLGTTFPLHR